jgi:hypothetical protein
MKKVALFLSVAALALSFTSCKKSYHCECSVAGITTKGASAEYNKKDADAAKTACENGSNSAFGVTCKFVED